MHYSGGHSEEEHQHQDADSRPFREDFTQIFGGDAERRQRRVVVVRLLTRRRQGDHERGRAEQGAAQQKSDAESGRLTDQSGQWTEQHQTGQRPHPPMIRVCRLLVALVTKVTVGAAIFDAELLVHLLLLAVVLFADLSGSHPAEHLLLVLVVEGHNGQEDDSSYDGHLSTRAEDEIEPEGEMKMIGRR